MTTVVTGNKKVVDKNPYEDLVELEVKDTSLEAFIDNGKESVLKIAKALLEAKEVKLAEIRTTFVTDNGSKISIASQAFGYYPGDFEEVQEE